MICFVCAIDLSVQYLSAVLLNATRRQPLLPARSMARFRQSASPVTSLVDSPTVVCRPGEIYRAAARERHRLKLPGMGSKCTVSCHLLLLHCAGFACPKLQLRLSNGLHSVLLHRA